MDVLIRKATIKDLEEVQELNLMLFEKEHTDYDSSLNMQWTTSQSGSSYFSG